MSKKINVPPPQSGMLIWHWDIQRLEGVLLTFIESLGLKETQEKAAKDILRNHVWEAFKHSEYVSSEIVEKIIQENIKARSQGIPQGTQNVVKK